MTGAAWLACTDPSQMARSINDRRASKRKRRLVGCACCRHIWHLIPDERSRSAVLVAEQFVDGLADHNELEAARIQARRACQQFKRIGSAYERHYATGACSCVV